MYELKFYFSYFVTDIFSIRRDVVIFEIRDSYGYIILCEAQNVQYNIIHGYNTYTE